MKILDFHCHHVPAGFPLTTIENSPPSQRARWIATNKLMNDEAFLLKDIEAGDVAARVINAPPVQMADASGVLPHGTIMRVNDALAAIAQRHPGRIHALATVNAYDGEPSARELERAVKQLGHRGVFVDCARGGLMIDAPEARPVLAAAAQLDVPVFVHPVNPQPLTGQMDPYGRLGTMFARGTINSAALIALIESGAFAELPDLKVVVTALAFGGLAIATGFSHMSRLPEGAAAVLRRNVYVETMHLDPGLIRASVDWLGADHVLAGSDFPIVNDGPIRARLGAAFAEAGLSAAEQAAIAAGNTERLLGINV